MSTLQNMSTQHSHRETIFLKYNLHRFPGELTSDCRMDACRESLREALYHVTTDFYLFCKLAEMDVAQKIINDPGTYFG